MYKITCLNDAEYASALGDIFSYIMNDISLCDRCAQLNMDNTQNAQMLALSTLT